MCRLLFLVLWKDLLARKYHWIWTALEIMVSIVFSFALNAGALLKTVSGGMPEEVYDLNYHYCEHFNDAIVKYYPDNDFTNFLMDRVACHVGINPNNISPSRETKCPATSDNISIFFNYPVKGEYVFEYVVCPPVGDWTWLSSKWRSDGSDATATLHNQKILVELMSAINEHYILMKGSEWDLRTELQSIPGYTEDIPPTKYWVTAIIFLCAIKIFFLTHVVVRRLVMEKESGAKQMMIVIGVPESFIWISKFIDAFVMVSILISIDTMCFYVPFSRSTLAVKNIHFLITWSFLLLSFATIIVFLFFLSCFFDRSIPAFTTSVTLCAIVLLSHYKLDVSNLSKSFHSFLCIMPYEALALGIEIIIRFQSFGGKPEVNAIPFTQGESEMTLKIVIIVLSFDIILYSFLTFYLNNLYPGKYGIKQRCDFLFKKKYWKFVCRKGPKNKTEFEAHSMVLQNVTHKFSSPTSGIFDTLLNVDLTVNKGEILAIEIPNYFSSAAFISLLTGLDGPGTGRIWINGFNATRNPKKVRPLLGICFRDNLLFENFSVEDNYRLLSMMKGFGWKESKTVCDSCFSLFGLHFVKDFSASSLPQSVRRKLCIAIALSGKSEIIVLNEPSVDRRLPQDRQVWKSIHEMRRGRTLLVITSQLQEALDLGHRIAILSKGKMESYKNRESFVNTVSNGYKLKVIGGDVHAITEMMNKHGIRTKISFEGDAIVYRMAEQNSEKFPVIFKKLEEMKETGTLIDFNLELFIQGDASLEGQADKVVEKPEDEGAQSVIVSSDFTYNRMFEKEQGCGRSGSQMAALIRKKLILFYRLIFLYFSVWLALFVIIIVLASHWRLKQHENVQYSPRALSMYYPSEILYAIEEDVSENVVQEFLAKLDSFLPDSEVRIRKVSDLSAEFNEIQKPGNSDYAKRFAFGLEFSNESLIIYYNLNALHMAPISVNLVLNAIHKLSENRGEIRTTLSVDRMRSKVPQKRECATLIMAMGWIGVFGLVFTIMPMIEKTCGAKRLQQMPTSILIYWLSHFLLDYALFLLHIGVAILAVHFISGRIFHAIGAGELIWFVIIWSMSLILVSYFIATLVSSVSEAIWVSIAVYLFFGFVIELPSLSHWYTSMLAMVHPNLIMKYAMSLPCENKKELLYFIHLFAFCALYIILIAVVECQILTRWGYRCYSSCQDSTDEEEIDLSIGITKDMRSKKSVQWSPEPPEKILTVTELRRWNGPRRSIPLREVNFHLNAGETLGLIGPFGGGKTTLLKILTGELVPSGGDARIRRIHMEQFMERNKFFADIGYCAQEGNLIPHLTGREMLILMAKLRGVPDKAVRKEVYYWIQGVGILGWEKNSCSSYNYLNRKKLSTAVALIGDPQLVLLDEPLSGLAPIEKRRMWELIKRSQRKDQVLIMTSRNLSDCEDVCDKIAVMAAGKMVFFGNKADLYYKCSNDYYITLRLDKPKRRDDVEDFKRVVRRIFEKSELIVQQAEYLIYRVEPRVPMSQLFERLENLKAQSYLLNSYSARQAHLEDVIQCSLRNEV